MYLSRKRIFNTVKFRIALHYALLFAFSSAICVTIAHVIIRRGLLNSFDRQLEADSRQFLYEYLTGLRYRQFDGEIPISAATQRELEAFRKKLPTIVLLLGFKKSEGDKHYQTFFGAQRGKLYELRLEDSGNVYSRELSPANHLGIVKNSFENRARLAGVDKVWYALYDSNGKLIASSPNCAAPALIGKTNIGFRVYSQNDSKFRILNPVSYTHLTLPTRVAV